MLFDAGMLQSANSYHFLPLGSRGCAVDAAHLEATSPGQGSVPGAESLPEVPLQTGNGSWARSHTDEAGGELCCFAQKVLVSSTTLGESQEVGLGRMLDIGPWPRGEREQEVQEREMRNGGALCV